MRRRENRPFLARLKDGLRGVREGWKRDQALRTHNLLAATAVLALLIIQPPIAWTLAVLVLVIAGVAAELVNSALEAALDKLHPDLDSSIGAAKEMASGSAAVINLGATALFIGAVLTKII